MSDITTRTRTHGAPLWAPGVIVGGVAGGLMAGPSLFPKDPKLQRFGVGIAVLSGFGVGVGGAALARQADKVLPGDRLHAELVLGGAGAATAGAITLATHGGATGKLGLVKSAATLIGAGAAAGALSGGISRNEQLVGGHDALAQLALAGAIGVGTHKVMAISAAKANIPVTSKLRPVPGFETNLDTFGQLATKREPWSQVSIASGGKGSLLPWDKLTPQGKDFLTRRPDAAEIAKVMETKTVGPEPIRAYAALDHVDPKLDELSQVKQLAKLSVGELERLNVFGKFEQQADGTYKMLIAPRKAIMAPAPTSTGFLNPVAMSSFEFQNLGDTAIFSTQVARKKAAMEMDHVARSTAQHQFNLEELHNAINKIPEGFPRPKVYDYGESYGAWSAQNGLSGDKANQLHGLAKLFGKWNGPRTYAPEGLARMDKLGIERALYVGTPRKATLRPTMVNDPAMTGGAAPTVLNMKNGIDATKITAEQASKARVSFLQHDADPVALFGAQILLRDAAFLGRTNLRGEGISPRQHSIPIVTFLQTALDQQNAQYFVKGTLEEKGHDYRSVVALAMRRAYGNAHVTDRQLMRQNEWNRQLEVMKTA